MKYIASVFVKDILDLFELNKTSMEYETLGFNIKRDLFYRIIKRKTQYLNDTNAEALKILILKKTNNENKKKLYAYLKKHIGSIEKIIKSGELEKIIEFAINQFKYKKKKIKKEINEKRIAEYYLKSLNYLYKDVDTSLLLTEEVIEEIIKSIIAKENLKFLNGNNERTLNTLIYKKIVPKYILNLIQLLNDIIPLARDIKTREVIHRNLKYIMEWFFVEYLNKSFESLEKKADNIFYKKAQEIKAYSLDDLEKKGWSIEEFSSVMLSLFHSTIDDLADDNTSTLEELTLINRKQRLSRRLIFKGNEAIGCWSLSPLFDEEFERDCRGEFYVKEFDTITMPIFFKGIYNIHFGVICLKEASRNPYTFNKLLFSLVKFVEDLSLEGIYINKICTQTYSEQGRSLAQGIGLKYKCKHQDGVGDVYVGSMKELINKSFLRDYELLKSRYKRIL